MKVIVPPQSIAAANCWFWTAKAPDVPSDCAGCLTVASGRRLLQGL